MRARIASAPNLLFHPEVCYYERGKKRSFKSSFREEAEKMKALFIGSTGAIVTVWFDNKAQVRCPNPAHTGAVIG